NVLEDAYEIFLKFAFGSAIYMFIASFLSIIANGLLLLVFLFDPLKIFRKATTYFLVGLSIADILTATTQQPMFATCFTMIYIKHRDTGKTCQTLISPVTILGMVSLYSSEDPNSPEFLIASLIVENVLYLKFLLDPFLYAWRIPKYRQALKIILRWNHSKNKKPGRGSMFSDCAIAELSLSRDTVITLDFKAISQ
ncbi:unnamed protein product, partial [Porites evermanni]